ncbi:YqaJ viral recombinase family protein [Escherichia coli]|uniref:lambda exonuclease family protein n=1 Tax=Escherichia coli TaxID=562 RepID=UPI000452DB66|nr:lambda exonuclease family protein [Escherichia coli]EFW7514527.1 YqaJ viral recombinase family protein [Shigella sonnei]ANP19119.1 exonuclease [Escherichia coli]EEC8741785.1 YqaJ viral recombinase family protein [Escherichia coli]EEC8794594.1 YqaJ viral recombinase family protein [Escherichia coli]EEC9059013.1 YqaJ viral recombinase family protein [Escherichia coli]
MTPEIILQRTGVDITSLDQGDDGWHKLRLGVITASEVHNVIAKPRSGSKWPDTKISYFHTLLAEVCTGVAPEVNAKSLAWGKQYEDDARALFEFIADVTVSETPIIFRDESMRTACSPDGLCSDGNGLELKCPFTSRDFMKFRLGGLDAIKPAYMAQVQFSMWVTDKDAWYFANYDPRMKREGLHYVVVERDEKYMASFDEMVPEFIDKMDEALAEIGFVFGEQWGVNN